jgi:uncharacterized membrane protein
MALHASDLGDVVPALLATHIGAGAIAVLSGVSALAVRKGERAHRAAGSIFVASMVVMGLTAAYLAYRIQSITLITGLLSVYLVTTSWLTVKSANGLAGVWSVVALLGITALAALEVWLGWSALTAPDKLAYGYTAAPYLVSAFVAVLAALMDVKVIVMRGVTGPARIARHLWRMCFALFVTLASFATQGLRYLVPQELKGTAVEVVLDLGPGVVVLVLMIWWLVRVRFGAWGRRISERPDLTAEAA